MLHKCDNLVGFGKRVQNTGVSEEWGNPKKSRRGSQLAPWISTNSMKRNPKKMHLWIKALLRIKHYCTGQRGKGKFGGGTIFPIVFHLQSQILSAHRSLLNKLPASARSTLYHAPQDVHIQIPRTYEHYFIWQKRLSSCD